MKSKLLTPLLATLVLLCGCGTGSTSLPAFLEDDTVRLEMDGVKVFSYNEALCQLSYNEQRREVRALTDTMLDYFVLTLDAIPASVGEKTVANILWSVPGGESSRNRITLEAKRIEGDLIWLCDDGRHTAAVDKVLK